MEYEAGLEPALIDRLWLDPDALVDAGTVLKSTPRSTVVRIDTFPRAFVLKRFNLQSAAHTIAHAGLRSRARWNWINASRLREVGLRTPTPLVCLEIRLGPLRERSFLLTDYVAGATLLDVLDASHLETEELDRLVRGVADIWRVFGDRRIGYDDMKGSNFLVDPDGLLWLVDLDGMRIFRSASLFRRKRSKDYQRFMRNWQGRPAIEAAFRAGLE